MSLRDRLLALLRDPAYSPANEFELSRRLDLKKRDRASLAHEVRQLLKQGGFVRERNGRIAASSGRAEKRPAESRKIFVPTRRGPTMPAPDTRDQSPVEAIAPVKKPRAPRKPKVAAVAQTPMAEPAPVVEIPAKTPKPRKPRAAKPKSEA